jgi:hypothetical protein
MKKNMDELSVELTEKMIFESFEKSLPPKLYYRWRKWMKQVGSMLPQMAHQKELTQKFEKIIQNKIIESLTIKELKKNEALASFYDNGIVKMDFGPEVDPKIRDAAIKWAKKRGLNAIEASLKKSKNEFETIIFSRSKDKKPGDCIKQFKIQF